MPVRIRPRAPSISESRAHGVLESRGFAHLAPHGLKFLLKNRSRERSNGVPSQRGELVYHIQKPCSRVSRAAIDDVKTGPGIAKRGRRGNERPFDRIRSGEAGRALPGGCIRASGRGARDPQAPAPQRVPGHDAQGGRRQVLRAGVRHPAMGRGRRRRRPRDPLLALSYRACATLRKVGARQSAGNAQGRVRGRRRLIQPLRSSAAMIFAIVLRTSIATIGGCSS